jgi:hypothetical protein
VKRKSGGKRKAQEDTLGFSTKPVFFLKFFGVAPFLYTERVRAVLHSYK